MKSINPATNTLIKEYREHSPEEVNGIIDLVHAAWQNWRHSACIPRAVYLRRAAALLRERKEELALLITREMGKILSESLAEVEKCAFGCDYYADQAEEQLKDLEIESDARRSYVTFEPLGVVLAVMPWNFPFWQVFRFAAPALMAGNAAVLKHASNVPGCALAIEQIFTDAGFPPNLFRTLLIPASGVERVLENSKIAAATLTGSEPAGSRVASLAGKFIKKTVLELGGSDCFIVLDDAEMDAVVGMAVKARMVNQGQSCIAAKRFIVTEPKLKEFEERITEAMAGLQPGPPEKADTLVGPLARPDLVDEIDRQVQASVKAGAKLLTGGKRPELPGCYYMPTVLTSVRKGMPAYDEETFGPLLAIIPAKDEEDAVRIANDSPFGLGGCVWTTDTARGERIARRVETGAMFVNGQVHSDPRLPFGGIKKSGYGRELSEFGIREFVNVKTIWIGG